MSSKTNYTAKDIDVLEGLEPVKQRPGMYTHTENPNHIIQEAVDNAKDEALGGFATSISVEVFEDGSVRVQDNGRGIPIDAMAGKKGKGRPAVEVILTTLHSGAKFKKSEDTAYQFSGGLHGVGVSVTNALSTRFECEIKRDGKMHSIAFAGGALKQPLKSLGKCDKKDTGTSVRVWPDSKYFDGPLDLARLEHYLQSSAVLLPQASISLKLPGKPSKSWSYPDGIVGYLQEQAGKDALWAAPPIRIAQFVAAGQESSYSPGEGFEAAFGWLEEGKAFGESYVNLIHTPDGGKHELGLRNGLFEALRNFAEHHGLLPKGLKIEADDVWGKACFMLSAKILDPSFVGQTKGKLGNESAVRMVSSMTKDPFELWLNDHVELAKKIADIAINSAMARSRSAQKVERKKSAGGSVLPGKLADCESENIEKNELFLVEGDSAGGSAKQGRSKEFQAILPLRGKLLNTWEIDPAKLYASATISDISLAIGVEPHGHLSDFESADISKLRYSKVIIMSDADVDGSHIQVLLLTLFYRHFPKLLHEGKIFIAQTPLFRVDAPAKRGQKGDRKFYALDEHELEEIQDRLKREGIEGNRLQVSRFKGLGEMNPNQLWETSMNPDTRRLLQVGFHKKDPRATHGMFDMLMSDKNAAKRRAWMETSGHLVEGDV